MKAVKHLVTEAAAFLSWLLLLAVAVPVCFGWVLVEDLWRQLSRKRR